MLRGGDVPQRSGGDQNLGGRTPGVLCKTAERYSENGVRMLRPGGKLLYSTCTFAPVENEESISWILEQCPEMELIPIEGYEGFSEGNPAWGDGREELRRCVRIWPHKMKERGIFWPC